MGNLNFKIQKMPRKSNAASKKATRKASTTQSSRANVTFPVGRIARHMRRLRLSDRIGQSASVYMAGVLDYITSEMLEGAGVIAEQKKGHLSSTASSDPSTSSFQSDPTPNSRNSCPTHRSQRVAPLLTSTSSFSQPRRARRPRVPRRCELDEIIISHNFFRAVLN